jgi:hypothetical protein
VVGFGLRVDLRAQKATPTRGFPTLLVDSLKLGGRSGSLLGREPPSTSGFQDHQNGFRVVEMELYDALDVTPR